MFTKLLFIIVSVGLIFWAVHMIKNHRELFTKENFFKSANTLGWLTLLLIGIIALCVWFLKH
ncbi:MAG: hypothetical protein A2298_04115 [Gammaproteobacteria bacterium RIFOXYB2_FULL_38_6]|nr:MAG: hypothetical protein A2298_04115 [Gammaproteobacteria bacterium RIFOXYB2_FULL_38_6]